MTTSYRRLVLHPFVVLLMLVAMVFVTAADAAACGAEVAPGSTPVLASLDSASASSAATDEVPGDSDAPTEQHGMCGHGHCHHGASFASTVQKDSVPHLVVVPDAPPSEALASVGDPSRINCMKMNEASA